MTTPLGANQAQWVNCDFHAYHNVDAEPVDAHETMDFNMLSPLVSNWNADSHRSCSISHTSTSSRSSPRYEEEKSEEHTTALPPSPLRPNFDRNSDLTLSLLMLLFPLLLYVLAGYAAVLDGRVVHDHQWTQLRYLMTKTVTIFPIIFAILLARAIRKLAVWKLENGSSLESLEQLMGSVTTGGTLSTIFTLRSHNFLAAGLVAVWALSPIGGQASLFLVDTDVEPVFSDMNVTYLDTNGNTEFVGADYNTVLEPLNLLLSSSIMAPTWSRNNSLDLWNNMKIPHLLQAGAPNSSNWTDITEGFDLTTSYTSLLGVPMFGIYASGNTTFQMETSYISVACLNVTSGPAIQIANGTTNATNETFSSAVLEDTDSIPNLSFALDGFNGIDAYSHGAFNSSNYPTAFAQDQRTLLVQSRITDGSIDSAPDIPYARAYCPLSTVYITAQVSCVDSICDVVAIRPSQHPHAPSTLIPFAYIDTFGEFAGNLATATPIPKDRTAEMSSPVELYIQDPNFIESGRLLTGASNLASVPIADFSLRLQHIINTYWQGSFDPTSTMGNIHTDMVATRSVTAKNRVWSNIYRCRWGWWSAYVFATTAMLTAAIASLTFDFLLKSPELLGYCSSLVRDSKYFDACYGTGSAIGAAERERTFKTLRLKLMDVGGETGSARLAVVQDGTVDGEPLERGRLYC